MPLNGAATRQGLHWCQPSEKAFAGRARSHRQGPLPQHSQGQFPHAGGTLLQVSS